MTYYLDLLGAITAFSCTLCFVSTNKFAWPLGIMSALINITLFSTIGLFGQAYLHTFYLLSTLFGWVLFKNNNSDWTIYSLSYKTIPILGIIIYAAINLAHIHLKTSMPDGLAIYDSSILILAIAAQLLTTMRFRECWLLWFTVDILSIITHSKCDLPFHMIQHSLYLGTAMLGLWRWHVIYISTENQYSINENSPPWLHSIFKSA